MKLWGIVRKDNAITADVVLETDYANREQVQEWDSLIGSVCEALDLARPVILKKHIEDIARFSRSVFTPDDFIETVDFDKFELVLFSESKVL